MDTYIRKILIKFGPVIFLTAGVFLLGENSAHALFMKKLTVEPLINPRGWQEVFRPGTAFALMLNNSLADSGQFQMVKPAKRTIKRRVSSLLEKPADAKLEAIESAPQQSIQTPSSHYRVRGRILMFDPDTDPLNEGHTEEEALLHKERAEIRAVIDLVNSHTGRSLAKKTFISISTEGRMPFNSDMNTFDYEMREFKSSSIGRALWKLNGMVETFVVEILSKVPLEGDLIWVDHKNSSAMINLGEANGIRVQDVFTVFSLMPDFNDPLNQTDLGDKFTRKGIIKIIEVQGRFSRAQILAGLDLAPGDLVVLKTRRPATSRSEKRSPQKNVIWGAFKGLPALSY